MNKISKSILVTGVLAVIGGSSCFAKTIITIKTPIIEIITSDADMTVTNGKKIVETTRKVPEENKIPVVQIKEKENKKPVVEVKKTDTKGKKPVVEPKKAEPKETKPVVKPEKKDPRDHKPAVEPKKPDNKGKTEVKPNKDDLKKNHPDKDDYHHRPNHYPVKGKCK